MQWFTINEAAVRAGVGEGTIRKARRLGKFPSAKEGEARGARDAPWLIPEADLDAAGFAPKAATEVVESIEDDDDSEGPVFIEQRLVEMRSELRSISAMTRQSATRSDSHQSEVLIALTDLSGRLASVERCVNAIAPQRGRSSWWRALARVLARTGRRP
jgi:hypothetical protein